MNDKVLEFNHDLTIGELIEVLQQFPQDTVVCTMGELFRHNVNKVEFNAEDNVIYLSE